MRTLSLFLGLLINAIYVLSGTVYKVSGISSGSHLNIRSGPSTGNGIVGKLQNGELIFATSTTNGWAKFYKGYVSMQYLTGASSSGKVTTTANLNFRDGPGTNHSRLTTLSKGTSVNYYGRDPFTNSWAVTDKGYASSSYLSGSGGSSGGSSGGNKSAALKKAEAAADYAKSKAHPKSTGWCAKYVANALQNAGFSFTRQGSACFYHTKGILKGMGFTNISKPGSLRKGDIAVHGCNGAHPHGHIQIYNGGKWYSDFAQNSVNVYSSNSPPVYYYRIQN